MNVKNCKRCGRLYTYTGFDLCPECYRQDEEDFLKLRDYIESHPNATMIEISRETQISTKRIMDFLKEGRLILNANNSNIPLTCERCGKPILTGRFCDECKNDMEKDLRRGLEKFETDKNKSDRLYLHDRTKGNK
ncbi:MAG: TIGR03826 family flagellar region protein [Thermoanaerobacteraceae bacterium]